MTALAAMGGLLVLLAGVACAVVLDLPGGPTGWRRPGPSRWALLALTFLIVLLAGYATWLRLLAGLA
jgi:hypothetical protein